MAENQRPTGPKHRTAKGAQRLQDLIAVAAELFLERGFDAVAVDDLIARVGGSRSNVYGHFGGKEGLFNVAMTNLCAEVAKPLEQMNLTGREPAEVLPCFGRQLLQAALAPRTLALHRLLVNEGRRFPEVAQGMWKVSYGKAVEILAAWIEEQHKRAEPTLTDEVPAKALATQFISMVTSDAKLRAASGLVATPLPDREVDEIVGHAVSTFLRGASTHVPPQASRRTKARSSNAV